MISLVCEILKNAEPMEKSRMVIAGVLWGWGVGRGRCWSKGEASR